MRASRVAVTIAAAALLFAVPSAAHALSWTQGGAAPFTGAQENLQLLSSGGKNRLVLPMKATGSPLLAAGSGYKPSSLDPFADGGLLITDTVGRQVVLFDSTGTITWTYSAADDPDIVEPVFAQRTNAGTFLVVDRDAGKIIELDANKQVVWSGDGFAEPHSAERIGTGRLLVAEAGLNRVIEIKQLGTDASTWDWAWDETVYGAKGVAGIGKNRLKYPTSAQRLASGNTLITDMDAHRVIEVSPSRDIKWRYGTDGTGGSSITQLKYPRSAWKSGNGKTTLIADTDNQRVLKITASGVQVVGDTFREPLSARLLKDGRVAVADASTRDGSLPAFGYSTATGIYKTGAVNLNAPGYRKWVSKISVSADVPSGTTATLYYSFDGAKKYTKAKGLSVSFSGKGRKCTYLHVQVRLKSANGTATPALKSLTIKYELAPPSGTGTGTGVYPGTGMYPGTGTGTGGTLGGLPLASQPTTTPATKSGGSATALPSGTAVEVQGVNAVYSGFVMDSVSSEMPGEGVSVNKAALSIDPTFAVATGVLLGTFYALGFAGPQLSQAASGAWGALREMTIGRMHG